MSDPILDVDAIRTGGRHVMNERFGWLDDIDALPRFAACPGVD